MKFLKHIDESKSDDYYIDYSNSYTPPGSWASKRFIEITQKEISAILQEIYTAIGPLHRNGKPYASTRIFSIVKFYGDQESGKDIYKYKLPYSPLLTYTKMKMSIFITSQAIKHISAIN